MDKIKINANQKIWVKLKEEGIEHYVNQHNQLMPFKLHTSFREYKNKANEFGYHEFQIWDFMDSFGGVGIRASSLFYLDFVFDKKDLKEVLI